MAESGREQIEADEDFEAAPHAGRQLGRSALWGCVALAAMGSAIYAARSETGIRRIATAWSLPDVAVASIPQGGFASAFDPSLVRETRRLAATVEDLTSERKQLIARLDTLERSVDVTGSLPPAERSAKGASSSGSPPAVSALTGSLADAPSAEPPAAPAKAASSGPARATARTAEPAGPLDDIVNAPTKASAPPAVQDFGAETSVYRTDFGLDLGGAATLEGLRGMWLTLKVQHAGLFEGLRPIVSVREGGGGVELRLVAGPLSNAAAATRLCVALADSRCKAVVFDGQRLAMR